VIDLEEVGDVTTFHPSEGHYPGTSMPDQNWWQELWPNPEAMMRAFGARSGSRALDLCCGDAYFTIALAKATAPEMTIGVDLDDDALELGRKAVTESGLTNIELITADARSLPSLVDGTFGLILLASTLHGIPGKKTILELLRSLLDPGGRLVIVNWHALSRARCEVLGKARGPRPELRMPPAALRHMAESIGLEEVQFLDVGPYHYAAVFERTTGNPI
jgi:SAM-dependent methyltransferase